MIADIINRIESRAELAGIPIADLLRCASVDYSTWWRWKAGKSVPLITTLERVEATLNRKTDLPK